MVTENFFPSVYVFGMVGNHQVSTSGTLFVILVTLVASAPVLFNLHGGSIGLMLYFHSTITTTDQMIFQILYCFRYMSLSEQIHRNSNACNLGFTVFRVTATSVEVLMCVWVLCRGPFLCVCIPCLQKHYLSYVSIH